MKTVRPLWGRGQMVSPQHFQQQAALTAWSAESIARMGAMNPWGIQNAEFDTALLKQGKLKASHLCVRFADGTLMERFITQTLKVFKWVGAAAGVVAVLWDSWHAVDEFLIKNNGSFSLGVAYLASAVGGALLWISAMEWLALSPLGIIVCLALVFGSAIYLASKEKDEIQKWLAAILWRKIPFEDKDIPAIMPTSRIEIEAFNKLMQHEGGGA